MLELCSMEFVPWAICLAESLLLSRGTEYIWGNSKCIEVNPLTFNHLEVVLLVALNILFSLISILHDVIDISNTISLNFLIALSNFILILGFIFSAWRQQLLRFR